MTIQSICYYRLHYNVNNKGLRALCTKLICVTTMTIGDRGKSKHAVKHRIALAIDFCIMTDNRSVNCLMTGHILLESKVSPLSTIY